MIKNINKIFKNFSILKGYKLIQNNKFKKIKEDNLEIHKNFENILNNIIDYSKDKHIKKTIKNNKLLVRDRIEMILDKNSPFLELSQLAGYKLYDNKCEAGGIITGIGFIKNKLCMIFANDFNISAGAYYPITVKKQIRAQNIALNLNLPCIYLVDSAGANLPLQMDIFPDYDHFGRIFHNQALMSKLKIPQISAVLGSCTAGGAYMPAMSDENIIVKNNGTIFLAGPPLVKAATNEDVTSEELGGADVHCKISGVSDHYVTSEREALLKVKDLMNYVNDNNNTSLTNLLNRKYIEPLYNSSELDYIIDKDLKEQVDSKFIISRILDNSEFSEFKEQYGKSLICGFGSIMGEKVGILSNNGVLFSDASVKGSHFIQLCEQRNIPLLFLQNITGFMVGKKFEHEGIAKHGAKLVNAVSTASVPKITVIVGASYGAGNYGMCGRAFDPDFLFTWPNSRTSVMGGEQASKVMVSLWKKSKNLNEEEAEKLFNELNDKYKTENSVYSTSSRLFDDGCILPRDTRKILGLSLFICKNKRKTDKGDGYGIFRM